MKEIPAFIIEEHHEAFIVWNYAVQETIIPKEQNVLYHIDEHSDMNVPRFNRSIHDFMFDLKKSRDFTYKELAIANFIIPSIYIGIFNKIYWFKQFHTTKKNKLSSFVRSYNQQGKRLFFGLNKEFNFEDKDRKSFDFFKRSIEQIPASNKNIILDIDLDFFSCAGKLDDLGEVYVQITKNEYESFRNNKYHRLRFVSLSKIDVLKEDKKYYYVINGFEEIYPCLLKVNKKTIIDRINFLGNLLREKKIKPNLITICRSRFSGFTPNDQWEYIESNLCKMLSRLYNLSITNIKDIQ